jgi:hypothetical protein
MSARWVEPEGTPEQIADACVAHLAAGGRVDVMRQTGRWEPTAVCEAGAFAYHLRNGTRFALVYSDPPQPEPAPAASRAWAGPFASPQPERPRGHTSICRCGGCLAAESARVDPPEGVTPDPDGFAGYHGCPSAPCTGTLAATCKAAGDCATLVLLDRPGYSRPDRVPAPEGVTVIGWTEPTDDEPRQLPIVWGNDIPDEGWERNGYGDPPGHFRTYGEPRGDASYIIRPIPSPPVPETERVRLDQIVGRRLPGKSWAVTEFGFDPMDGYVAQGHPSDDDLHPVAPFYVDADGYVSVLPLDGTDGD